MAAPQPPAPFGGGAAAASMVKQQLEYTSDEASHERDVSEEETVTPAAEEEARHKEITAIARTFSNLSQKASATSTTQANSINTFLDPAEDPTLDPNSDQFSSLKWVRNFLQMTRDSDRYPKRTAGVSFRNLNVFGYGSGADYQTNFANAWLKMFNWAKSRAGFGKKVRIDILRDFEGMVNAGEMLVVLGRPGR